MEFSRYFEFAKGNTPVILSCPHGGFKKPNKIPDKTIGPRIADKNTYFIAKLIISSLKVKNISIFYILNKIHRSKVDLNRPSQSESSFNRTSIEAQTIFHSYHELLNDFAQECISNHGRVLIIDFHGFTKPYSEYPDVIFGHIFGKTLDLLEESNEQDCNKYWGCSQLQSEISKYFKMDDGLALTEHNLSYSGGYIAQQFFKKKKINAIQIEVAKCIRLDFQLTETLVKAITNAVVNLNSKK
jgi:N-formylglutamate amidohydrolase